MTDYFIKYLKLRDDLYEIRVTIGKGYWCDEEEPIIEQMDDMWSKLSKDELQFIRSQGSWKFKDIVL